uniref:TLC domain-containing protein n=1 Tax=Macrostomum lignano TaxID=282301 RepID=A0A1I8G8D1_9PLAT
MAASGSPSNARTFPDSYYEDPTLYQFFERILISLNEFAYNDTKYPHDYQFTYHMVTSVKLTDILTVLMLGTVFTILRYIVTATVSLPLAESLNLKRGNRAKWPESVWKFLIYTGLWGYSYYVVIYSGRHNFFQKPLDIFKDIVFDEGYLTRPIPVDVYWMYALQLGFYVHSIYGTVYMDVWRKDSYMMLFHHGLTIFLLEFSFLMKYYKIGALVLLIHDLSDVILELTKLNIYMKDRAGRHWPLHEWMANIGFLAFTVSWAWFRLFWFPLKVLYTSHWGVYVYHKDKDPKMFLFFNTMLFVLQFLHIYWFYFVLVLLVKVASGRQKEVDDTREFDERDSENGSGGHGSPKRSEGEKRSHAD